MTSSSQKSQDHGELHPSPGNLQVTILASEWRSTKGALSTISRELAIELAKFPEVKITYLVPKCSQEDKTTALRHHIQIVESTRLSGYDELEWLGFLPDDLQIDVIVGHGVKLGRQAQVIRKSCKCKWIQVVHTDPEELGMYKSYQNPISTGEKKHKVEVELCEKADFVVGVGPKLCEAFRRYLHWCKKDKTILDLTPGVFDEFVNVEHASEERERCGILVCCCGDAEDFQLKGFDVAAKAVAELSDAHLVFVGAPEGRHEGIAKHLLECGLPAHRLTVRSFLESREDLRRLFCEVDLVVMPSRTEGFGLTGLEALSAGLPVLVSKNSGFGEALCKVPFGSACVIDSEDSLVWAEAIQEVWKKDRVTRLQEAELLRSSYKKKYSWAKQSEDLVKKMLSIVNPDCQSSSQGDEGLFVSSSTQATQMMTGEQTEPSLCMKHEPFEEVIAGFCERLDSDQANVTCKIRNMSLKEQNTSIDMRNTSEPGTKAHKEEKSEEKVQEKEKKESEYNSLASEYFNQGNFKEAIEYLKRYLNHCKKVGKRAGAGRTYANLGKAYLALSDSQEAIKCHQLQLSIARELRDRPGEGRAFSNLGSAYFAHGDMEKAIYNHKQHLNIAREKGDAVAEGRAYANLSNAYISLGDFKTAIEYLELRLGIVKELGDRVGEGHVYANLGIAYQKLGYFKRAIQYHESDLSIAKEIGDRAGEGKTYANIGNVYLSNCMFQKAIEYHLLHLSIAKEVDDRAEEGNAYAILGNAYLSLGDFSKAMECHHMQLCIAKEVGDIFGEGGAYGNLGIAYKSLGNFRTAIEYHEKDRKIAKDVGDRASEGRAYANLGNTYFSLGDFRKAIECHEQHLEIAKEVGDKAREGTAYGNLGIGYRNLGNFKDAIVYHERHLSIAKEMRDRIGEGRAYCNLGIAYYNLGDFKKAMNYHHQHLNIAKEVNDRAAEGAACGNLGVVLRSLGDFKTAVKYLMFHRSIAEEVGDKAGEGAAFANLGNVYESLGDYQKALECHQHHLQIAQEVGDKAGEGRAFGNLGNAYDSLGNFIEAINFHQRSLEVAKVMDDKVGEGRAYANLGIAYHNIGNFKTALDLHNQHLCIVKDVGDRSGEGCAYANLGIAFDSLGDFTKAKEYHNLHLTIAEELGDRAGVGRAYANLGNTYRNLGEIEQAISYHQLDLAIAKETGDRAGKGRAYANLGISYHSLGDFKKAIDNQQLSLTIAKKMGDRAGEGRAYANLGNAFDSVGDFQEAAKYHEQHLSIAKEVGDRAGEGRAYANLGNALLSLKDLTKAIDYHQRHLSIAKEVADRVGEGCAYANLGNAFFSLGDVEKAIEYHQKHLSISKEVGDIAGEGGAYANLGRAYNALGESEKALYYHEKHLQIAHEMGDIASEGRAYASLGDTYVSRGELCKSENCYKSSVELFDSVRERLCFQDEWKISVRNYHNRVYTALWMVQLKQCKIYEALLTAEQGRAQALMDLIKSSYGFEFRSPKPHEKDEQKIDTWYHVTSPTVFIAVGKEEINFWVLVEEKGINFREKKIGEHCPGVDAITFLNSLVENAYREMLECTNSNNNSPLRLLYDVLISPISDLIGCEEVIFVPDGPLFLAPFAAFQDHSHRYLCESFRTRLIPSLTSLKLITDCTEWYHFKSGALLVGDPYLAEVNIEGNVHPLPFARTEVESIGRILDVQPLTGKNATKLEVLKRLSKVALVHIASHGKMETGEIILSPNPVRSSNVLEEKDFMLTMGDVLRTGVRARLVVLSCCHSGRGEIKAEGVVGMARAFLGAGARSILVSLCAVDDMATFEFMTCFYRQVVKGTSASEAVNIAQKHLKNKPEFNAANYWAPFVLIGDDITLDPNIWNCKYNG